MEQKSQITPIRSYLSGGKRVKVDIFSRQARVNPVFEQPLNASEPVHYVKVYGVSDCSRNGDLVESFEVSQLKSLFAAQQTQFNALSQEYLLNAEYSNRCGTRDRNPAPTPERPDSTSLQEATLKRRLKHFEDSHSFECYKSGWVANLPWVVSLVSNGHNAKGEQGGRLAKTRRGLNGSGCLDKSTTAGSNSSIASIGSIASSCPNSLGHNIGAALVVAATAGTAAAANSNNNNNNNNVGNGRTTEDHIRNVSAVLSSFIRHLDSWRHRVLEALQNDLTLKEAKELHREFTSFSNGMVQVDLADQLAVEIQACQKLASEIREMVPLLFHGQKNGKAEQVDLRTVEHLLRASLCRRLLIPEVQKLKLVFAGAKSLRHLIDDAFAESQLSACQWYLADCGKYAVSIPNVESLRALVVKYMWIQNAKRILSKNSKYTSAKELLQSVPPGLEKNETYHELAERVARAEEWLQQLTHPTLSALLQDCGEDVYEVAPPPKATELKPASAAALEQLVAGYGKLELGMMIFKHIEPIYVSFKRLQKRITRATQLLESDGNTSISATDCLVVLQHAEPMSKVIDLSLLLSPLRKGVEAALSFDQRSRKVLNQFKARCMHIDVLRLRGEPGDFKRLRKHAQVTTDDLLLVIKLLQEGIENKEDSKSLDFNLVGGMLKEFESLKLKNWIIQRELAEIHEMGNALIAGIKAAVACAKTEVVTDANIVHIVSLAFDVLRFGADIKLDSLLQALGYYLWISNFYPILHAVASRSSITPQLREMLFEALSHNYDIFMHKPARLDKLPHFIVGERQLISEYELLEYIK